jgi:hypothetical protein
LLAPTAVDTSDAPDQELMATLSVKLAQDQWQPNRAWSARKAGRSLLERNNHEAMHRWRFNDSGVLDAIVGAEKEQSESKVPPPSDATASTTKSDAKVQQPDSDRSNASNSEGVSSSTGPATTPPDSGANDASPPSTPAGGPPVPGEQVNATRGQSPDPSIESDSSPQSDENKSSWDGFQPLNVGQLLDGVVTSEGNSAAEVKKHNDCGNDCLRRLVARNNLVGWNAAILWGQRDPRGAGEAATVLERLVTKPPTYERAEDETPNKPG